MTEGIDRSPGIRASVSSKGETEMRAHVHALGVVLGFALAGTGCMFTTGDPNGMDDDAAATTAGTNGSGASTTGGDAAVAGGSTSGNASPGAASGPGMLNLPTCESELTLPNLTQDATLQAGKCYTVSGSVAVKSATLHIEPGVVLKFKQNASLIVSDEGAISALGTAAAPITFMGSITEAAHWTSLIVASDNPKNELSFVQFAHGGSAVACCKSGRDGATLIVSAQARISIRDSVFSQSGLAGIEFEAGARIQEFARNRFFANAGAPVNLPANLVGALDVASDYAGPPGLANKKAFIEVDENTVSDDATWLAANVPYRARNGIVINAALTLSPGVAVGFGDGTGLQVSSSGTLSAVGTAEKRIALHGTNMLDAGEWLGLLISSRDQRNQLQFVDIVGAGSATWCCMSGRAAAAIELDPNSRLGMQDTVVSQSASYGLHTLTGSDVLPFARNAFRNNQGAPLNVTSAQMAQLDAASTFKGDNREDRVVISGGKTGAGTWPALDVPYRAADDIDVDGTIEMSPGATLLFDMGVGLWVSTGSFSAVSAAHDIRFAGVLDKAGGWIGLGFASGDPRNLLDGVSIDGAGSGAWCCKSERAPAGVLIDAGGAAIVRNSSISRSGGWGLFKTASAVSLMQSGNMFSANTSGDAN